MTASNAPCPQLVERVAANMKKPEQKRRIERIVVRGKYGSRVVIIERKARRTTDA